MKKKKYLEELEDMKKLLDKTIDIYIEGTVVVRNYLEIIQRMLNKYEKEIKEADAESINLDEVMIKKGIENLEQELDL